MTNIPHSKTKVLHVINSLSTGGAERLIVDSIPLYREKGIASDVLILKDLKTVFRSKLEDEANVKVISLTRGSLYNPFLIFKLFVHLKDYDLIHVHLFPSLYWTVLAKWITFSPIPIIYTEHNTHNRRRDHFFLKIIDKCIYSKLSFIGCISEGTYLNLKRHLGKVGERLNIEVINNGIDLSRFDSNIGRTADVHFSDQKSFILIQVSSFREQKDQKTLIRAMVILPEDVKLILVGDGVLRNENEALVKQLNLTNRVTFLGNRYDVPELLQYSDLVILSSHHEGFGLAIVEGMASGKPVVASNVAGLREIVEGCGLLFEKENSVDLAEQVLRLYNDAPFYQKTASMCLKRAQAYSIHKMIDNYIKKYKEVLLKAKF